MSKNNNNNRKSLLSSAYGGNKQAVEAVEAEQVTAEEVLQTIEAEAITAEEVVTAIEAKQVEAVEAQALTSAEYVRMGKYTTEATEEEEAKEARVYLYAQPINPKDFNGCELYSYIATRGDVKGQLQYLVSFADFEATTPNSITRTSLSDNLLSQLEAGTITDVQFIAKMIEAKEAKAKAKLAKAEAKQVEAVEA